MNLMTLKIIWAALLGSHFMYGFALKFLIGQNTSEPMVMDPLIISVLSSFALILFYAAIFLPRYFLRNEKKQLQSQNSIEVLLPKFFAPFIIRLAMFEAGALIGFCLAFMNMNIQYFYPFASISLVAYFLNFPTEEKIKEAFI